MLDHLVLAAPDLAGAARWFADVTGVTPAPGGSHPGLGTANFLVALEDGRYLEIIGPDPDQPPPNGPRPFRIDELDRPRVVTWAVRTSDIRSLVARARAAGYDPGEPISMSRRAPTGDLLEWQLTPPRLDHADGLLPFVIDWGSTPHPTSRTLPSTPLLELTATHPAPASIEPALAALGVDLPVAIADSAAINVVVRGANGPVRF